MRHVSDVSWDALSEQEVAEGVGEVVAVMTEEVISLPQVRLDAGDESMWHKTYLNGEY